MTTAPPWRSDPARRARFTWQARAARQHAWRSHPFYAGNLRVVFPGLGLAAAGFAAFWAVRGALPGGGATH
jgi:hypothetical protein